MTVIHLIGRFNDYLKVDQHIETKMRQSTAFILKNRIERAGERNTGP